MDKKVYYIGDIHPRDSFYGMADEFIGQKITFIDGPHVWNRETDAHVKGWVWSRRCLVNGESHIFFAIKIGTEKPLSLWQKLLKWRW